MYAQCHMLVLPSRWEGFGLVAVEAMASGRPVLSTAVDGLEQVLGDVGVRFAEHSIEGFRDTISRLLDQPGVLEAQAKRGPERAANFSIEPTVQSYESLYRQLASRE